MFSLVIHCFANAFTSSNVIPSINALAQRYSALAPGAGVLSRKLSIYCAARTLEFTLFAFFDACSYLSNTLSFALSNSVARNPCCNTLWFSSIKTFNASNALPSLAIPKTTYPPTLRAKPIIDGE